MKTILMTALSAMLFLITMTSCNQEDLFVEAIEIVDEQTDETSEEDTSEEDNTEEDTQADVSIPCEFTLDSVEPNSTIIIDCILDLQGQTINLPASVTLLYEGGDIINGTLNFSDNGIISGELLNYTLTIAGVIPQVKDPLFEFIPSRWGIVEGEVPLEVAELNSIIINELLIQTKSLGVETFKLDKVDAYFYGDKRHKGGIHIPSNMHFKMSNLTHLRIFITSIFRALIYIKDVENVKVSGGFLHGSRNLPGFDPYNGGGNLICISSGINILMEDIHMSESAGDGMNFFSSKHAVDPDYVPSRNITVRNCIFDSNRRNNLSITDGHDYLIDGCTFLNAGIDMTYSKGQAPRYAIDLEPHMPNQKLERVTIRNCTESGSVAGGMVFANGKDYLFENNSFEGRIANTVSQNVRIINNNLGGIIIGLDNAVGSSKNTVISGNTLRGPADGTKTGIQLYNQDVEVFNNTILDFGVGIQLISLKDSHIYNNIIESDGPIDDGINALFYVDNVLVENNTVKVNDKPYFFAHVNKQDEHIGYSFTFKNNTFESEMFGMFSSTSGLNFIENTLNSGISIVGCIDAVLDGNTIRASKPYCISIGDPRTNNLRIVNNILENDDTAGQGSGIIGVISSTDDKNIEISNNQFSVKGYNRGVFLEGFNGIIIKDNAGYSEFRALIDYTGNNSTITNNINLGEDPVPNDISGYNNIVN